MCGHGQALILWGILNMVEAESWLSSWRVKTAASTVGMGVSWKKRKRPKACLCAFSISSPSMPVPV